MLLAERPQLSVEPLAGRGAGARGPPRARRRRPARVRAHDGRRHELPRHRRAGPGIRGRGLLLLLRGGALGRAGRAAHHSARRARSRDRVRGVGRAAARAAHAGAGRAGEQRGTFAGRGPARHAPPGRARGRVRRLGHVLQRDGRRARGQDQRALGGAGPRAAVHGRRRARAAHAAHGRRQRGIAPGRAHRAHAARGAAAGGAARGRRQPPARPRRGPDGDLPARRRHAARAARAGRPGLARHVRRERARLARAPARSKPRRS